MASERHTTAVGFDSELGDKPVGFNLSPSLLVTNLAWKLQSCHRVHHKDSTGGHEPTCPHGYWVLQFRWNSVKILISFCFFLLKLIKSVLRGNIIFVQNDCRDPPNWNVFVPWNQQIFFLIVNQAAAERAMPVSCIAIVIKYLHHRILFVSIKAAVFVIMNPMEWETNLCLSKTR